MHTAGTDKFLSSGSMSGGALALRPKKPSVSGPILAERSPSFSASRPTVRQMLPPQNFRAAFGRKSGYSIEPDQLPRSNRSDVGVGLAGLGSSLVDGCRNKTH